MKNHTDHKKGWDTLRNTEDVRSWCNHRKTLGMFKRTRGEKNEGENELA